MRRGRARNIGEAIHYVCRLPYNCLWLAGILKYSYSKLASISGRPQRVRACVPVCVRASACTVGTCVRACIACVHCVRALRACIACVHCVRALRACIPCVHSVRAFRACIPCVHSVRAFRACIPCVHSVRAFRACIPCVHSVRAFRACIPCVRATVI